MFKGGKWGWFAILKGKEKSKSIGKQGKEKVAKQPHLPHLRLNPIKRVSEAIEAANGPLCGGRVAALSL